MGSKNSLQDQDGTTWQTVGVPLGLLGLDLRQPITPNSLTKLINARFADERSVARREGHAGQLVVDASDYPAIGSINTVGWVYGHGQLIDTTNPRAWEQAHHPVAGQAQGTFNFDGADVVWTGDRLLVLRDDGNPALGSSTFWRRDNTTTTPLAQGIPAYLPLQVDSNPPDTISGSIVETCLTDTLRVIAATTSSGQLYGWIIDRSTGAVINKTELGGVSGLDQVHVINSGNVPVVLWRNGDNHLCLNYWTGVQWAGKSDVDTGPVSAVSVAPVEGGFHVAWLVSGVVYVGRYFGAHSQSTPYLFKTAVSLGVGAGNTVNGPIALAVAPNGTLHLAMQVTGSTPGLYVRAYTATADGTNTTAHKLVSAFPAANPTWDAGAFNAGLTAVTRGLKNQYGWYPLVVYAASSTLGMHAFEIQLPQVEGAGAGGTATQLEDDHRFNTALASRAFLVGDETFVWCRATNANTHYLAAGVHPQVCGFSDREDAPARLNFGTGIQALSQVVADPLSTTAFTWARPFTTGQAYVRAGNALIGDMEFLPQLSVARYGKTAYLSGSAVRCWDGIELGDTGFQDYPTIASQVAASGGSMEAGDREFRVYAVRYNRRGERFQSAAVTGALITSSASGKVTLTINTLPDTNHSDVQLEVYRTQAGGTTFYLDGSIANDLTAGTVTYVSTQADATLKTQPADPFATGVGNVSEIENWGPIGCSVLAVVGDRMWCCGGQVPAGFAQFSKLKEDGSGVGFDDLAGLEEVNTLGDSINSIIAYGDSIIFFEIDRIDVLAGTGPDNNGIGSWGVPQMVLSDGATTHFGTVVTQVGVLYWGVDGPRLLTPAFRVLNICLPVRPLTKTMVPSGVRVDQARQEVVWYTAEGDAVLWNYVTQPGRWAQWTGLPVAGVSDVGFVEPDGWLLKEDTSANGDNGRAYEFAGCTSELYADKLLGGATLLRMIGLVGVWLGEHQVQLRVYYNGAPCWTDEFTWQPDTDTWLQTTIDFSTLTPAQVDALFDSDVDRSGQYATHRRVSRPNCRTFRVAWSDIKSDTPTFTPYELSLELGSRGGLGRVAINTFAA